jgi:hypothetical protein
MQPRFLKIWNEWNPFVITQNGEASMVIEGVKQFQERSRSLRL